jgi:alpha-tubulin suppressor-like RCC1 family protein
MLSNAASDARRRAAAIVSLVALCVFGASCVTPATVIVVRMDTNIPDDARVELQFTASTEGERFGTTSVLSRGVRGDEVPLAFPSSLSVVARAGARADARVRLRFSLRLLGRNQREADRSITVERALRFEPQRTTTTSVFFAVECANVRCADGETCGAGGLCEPIEGTPTAFDRSAEPDARTSDVAPLCTPDCADRQCGDDGCGGSCGACMARPGADVQCTAAGRCEIQCAAGSADCDGDLANGCEASLTSGTSCGRCGRVCADATPVCNAATRECATGCDAAQTRCGSTCVDVQTSPSHCGRCANVCPSGARSTATCAAGVCGLSCAAGFGDCDGFASNGCEVDTSSSPQHCGRCGNVCGSTGRCNAGVCVRPVALSVRDAGGCVRLDDGTVRCWGNNGAGGVGVGRGEALIPNARPLALTNVHDVSTAEFVGCAVHGATRTVSCWGDGSTRLFGDSMTDAFTPVAISGLVNIVSVVTDGATACALATSGAVSCWGASDLGQCGVVMPVVPRPVRVALPRPAQSIAIGRAFVCARLDDSSVHCWGSNQGRALTLPLVMPSSASPVLVLDASNGVIEIAAGAGHACARAASNELLCWGSNNAGQIGYGALSLGALRRFNLAGYTIERLWAGGQRTCVRSGDATKKVLCTGAGPLGNGTTTSSTRWVVIPSLSGATELDLSANGCVIASDAVVRCWGSNANAALGNGTVGAIDAPLTIPGLTADQIVAGNNHFLARRGSTVWCWGQNNFGECEDVPSLGSVVNERSTTAIDVAGGTRVSFTRAMGGVISWVGQSAPGGDVRETGTLTEANIIGLSSRSHHTCVIAGPAGLQDVRCTTGLVPAAFSAVPRTASATAVGVGTTGLRCARVGGEVRCWGSSPTGHVFGVVSPTATTRTTATQIGTITDAIDFSVGRDAVFILRTSGAIEAVGNGAEGDLGTGDVLPRTTPTRVALPARALSVQTFAGRSCAVVQTMPTSLYCWGDNGAASFVRVPGMAATPQQIENSDNVTSVAVGAVATCLRKADGSVGCWGVNSALGLGTDAVGFSLLPRPIDY